MFVPVCTSYYALCLISVCVSPSKRFSTHVNHILIGKLNIIVRNSFTDAELLLVTIPYNSMKSCSEKIKQMCVVFYSEAQ